MMYHDLVCISYNNNMKDIENDIISIDVLINKINNILLANTQIIIHTNNNNFILIFMHNIWLCVL